MADTPIAPDAGQTLFSIPEEILAAFRGVSQTITSLRQADWPGLGLVGLGLVILLIAVIGIYFEETVQKPGREFVQSDLAKDLVKGVA